MYERHLGKVWPGSSFKIKIQLSYHIRVYLASLFIVSEWAQVITVFALIRKIADTKVRSLIFKWGRRYLYATI